MVVQSQQQQQQQPFAGSLQSNGTLMQQQVVVAATNPLGGLALPQQHQQQQQSQSQYSPQANYYQQQLIKSAQQQQHHFMQNHSQQQAASSTTPATRLNGVSQATANSQAQYSSQQNSPTTNQQQQQQQVVDSIYNGLGAVQAGRPGPIYAPKPAIYPQYATNQGAQSGSQQPLYQQQQQQPPRSGMFEPAQQQHSPASGNLSVRQLPVMAVQPNGLQAPSSIALTQHQLAEHERHQQQQQQQQQMQQLIMSYHQQHLPPAAVETHPHQLAMAHNQQHASYMAAQQQQADLRWPPATGHPLHHEQHQLAAPVRTMVHRYNDDRDSISTLSRFNQFDDRRSFTMKSQYTTNGGKAARNSRKFSFLKLTGEALRGILGLGGDTSLCSGDKSHLQKNLLNSTVTTQDSNNNPHTKPFGMQIHGGHQAAGTCPITAIDSGEDYYFKRMVFKYRLVIMWLVNLLLAALVLLSPVAMLLIPKMEFLFRSQPHEFGAPSDTLQLPATSGASSGGITHGVGIGVAATKQQVQQAYYTPQPQWRISDCNSDCDGPLIGFVCRLIMLCLAYWAIFFRPRTASLPRIDFHRCLLTAMAFLLTLAYWLFFAFRLFDKRFNDFELQYMTIVQFALSLLESLILLHYLAIVLLELRHRKKAYCLKVVRSPDGASQYYSCGSLSIQKCAQFVLEKYHRDFRSFNPLAEHQLQLENQLAAGLSSATSGGHRTGRAVDDTLARRARSSRPSSPANSLHRRGDATSGRRSNSRASRHRSRGGGGERSASNSPSPPPPAAPARSARSRSQRGGAARQTTDDDGQVRTYQLDAGANKSADELQTASSTGNNNESQLATAANGGEQQQQAAENNGNNSADQSSSDAATSRMKESSLETIKAASSTADLLSADTKSHQKTPASASGGGAELVQQRQQQQQLARDDTESVRSARSRRSTAAGHSSRSHHRHHRESHHSHSHNHSSHHHHHNNRERSSSRAHLAEAHSHSVSLAMPATDNGDVLEEHERKLRRRKLRLLGAVQDSFDRLKRVEHATGQPEVDQHNQLAANSTASLNLHQHQMINQHEQAKNALGPQQAARSVYPSIARSLQKYLRLTKQTGRHNLQSIYEHLSKCLLYGLSARTFMEKFTNHDPVWQQSETNLFADCKLADSALMYPARSNSDQLEINSWSLVCDTLLSRHIDSGTFFVLQQGQVSLLVTVAKLPHLSLEEQVINPKSCKFSLEPNSESAV